MSTENNPVLTPEQEREIAKKFLGDDPENFIKKSEILSDEDKRKLEEKKKSDIVATGLSEGWFNKDSYDEFQKVKATDPIEVAKNKFIEDNPDLEDHETVFRELFAIDEPDELSELGDEKAIPNKKKIAGKKIAEKMANDYIASKFGNISNADKKYENLQLAKKNAGIVAEAISKIPSKIEIEVPFLVEEGQEPVTEKYTINIDKEDIDAALENFSKDPSLLGRKDVDAKDVVNNALLFIQARSFNKIVSEIVTSAVSASREAYERGEKGITPQREDNKYSRSKKDEFVKKHGIV